MYFQLYLSVFLAVSVSALCSIFEATLYSLSVSQIEVLDQSGKKSGAILKKLKKDIHRPITAILTLNTIANTMGAAVAGASFIAAFGDHYLGLFSAVFTLFILLFSEILPKTVGVAYARELAPWVAAPIQWMIRILAPVVWLCRAVTRLIPKRKKEHSVSQEEILAIAVLSRESGVIDPEQEKVIANILKLRNKIVRQVMTPRTVTFSLSEHLTVAEAREMQEQWNRHSRAPIYATDPDDVVGIVLRKDVFLGSSPDCGDKRLAELMQPVHFVPEAAPLNRILLDFFERRQHLFVVVDEYGSVTGVISLEDIIEEIVGREIVDETDLASNMREFARRKRKMLQAGTKKV
ncbi:MAG: hemolysin family protein [Desulfobacterales bacterium]|nr:hemolysin family protein [Desulfobacterales bacterium]